MLDNSIEQSQLAPFLNSSVESFHSKASKPARVLKEKEILKVKFYPYGSIQLQIGKSVV